MWRAEQRDGRRAREIRGDEREHQIQYRGVRFGRERERVERLTRHPGGTQHLTRDVHVGQRPSHDERHSVDWRRFV